MIGLRIFSGPFLALLLLAGTLVIISLVGCSDNTNPGPTFDSTIRGTVTDADGHPVPGTGILVSLWPSVAHARVLAVPDGGHPTLKTVSDLIDMQIFDYCGDPVRKLDPGQGHQPGDPILIDGKNDDGLYMTDGIYFVRAAYEDTMVVQDFLMVRDPVVDGSLATHSVLTTTDDDGGFVVSQECLPFGYEFEIPGTTDSVTVSRYVFVRALGALDQSAMSDSIFVDANSGAVVTVQFP